MSANQIDTENESGLTKALAQLESCLETPVVPGELVSWLRAAQLPMRTCVTLFEREVEEAHCDLLDKIERNDLGLAHRVKNMRREDENLISSWQAMESDLEEFCEVAVETEPNEARLSDSLNRFTLRAIGLVIKTRRQESALTTWYLESLQRDRGTAD